MVHTLTRKILEKRVKMSTNLQKLALFFSSGMYIYQVFPILGLLPSAAE